MSVHMEQYESAPLFKANDKEISELLQHIIAPGFVASGESQPDVIDERFADPAQA